MKTKILIIVSIIMFSSCNVYKDFSMKEESQDNKQLTNIISSKQYSTQDSIMSWEKIYTDNNLQTLIHYALNNNTDMQKAELQIQEAEEGLVANKLSFLPSLSFDGQGQLSKYHKEDLTKTYQLPFSASWEIDVFGSLRNKKKKQEAVIRESQAYKQAIQAKLIANVAAYYYTLSFLDEELKITEQTKDYWQQNITTTKQLMQAGVYNSAAVSQAEANYYSICATIYDYKQEIHKNENNLLALINDTIHTITRSYLSSFTLPQEFNNIPISTLSLRPDVKQAESRLEECFYQTLASKSAFYPSLNLSGSLGWTNSVGGIITNPAQIYTSLLASLTQPIFSRGQLTSNLKISKAQEKEAQLTFYQTILDAAKEVNNLQCEVEAYTNKEEFLNKRVESMQSTVNATQMLMKNSSTTYLEVLTAQNDLLSSQITLLTNKYNKIISSINLYQALGGK